MRALMWLGLLVLIILALKKKSQPAKTNQAVNDPVFKEASSSSVETMVCCAHCHLYIPASEAVSRGQQVYCSAAHADLH